MRRTTPDLFILTLLLWIVSLPLAPTAQAAPPSSTRPSNSSSSTAGGGTGGSASASTNSGPQASGRSGPGGKYTTDPNKGFKAPDFVYGGNAISLHAPIQFGLTPNGFIPRGRIALQYDRQLRRAHWLHINAAALFDRGSWHTFRMDSCGLESQTGLCNVGTTAGMDVALGYSHKLFIEKKPWIVPTFRLGLVGGFWVYPEIGGSRQQTRELSWMIGIQAAAGLRFFLLRELALGLDVELRPGLGVHRERAAAASTTDNDPAFMLPLQVLPLLIEWRF